MKLEHRIRLIAGTLVLISLVLGHWVSAHWYWLTAFVGLNLIQSSFTKWCLMENILRKCRCAGPDENASKPSV